VRYRRAPDPELGVLVHAFLRNAGPNPLMFDEALPVRFRDQTPTQLLANGDWTWHDTPAAWPGKKRTLPPGGLTVWSFNTRGTNWGVGTRALSLLVGAWCLTGFEAAADLAEETHQPRRVVPRAIVLSLLSSGIAGFMLLSGVMLAIRDLPAAQKEGNPLMATLEQVFGAGWMTPVLVVVSVSVFACGLASMAATSRLLFALARDRMLPGSRWLGFVAEGQRTPRNAILFIWAVSSAVVLGLPSLDIITQISAVAGYLGYAGIIIAALRAPVVVQTEGFRLGRARVWIGGAALVWVLGLVAALTLPPTPLAGIKTQHLPALSTAIAIAIGVVLYFGLIRRRLKRGEAGPPTTPNQNYD